MLKAKKEINADIDFLLNSIGEELDNITGPFEYEKYGHIKKDIFEDDILEIEDFAECGKSKFKVKCINNVDIVCSFKREKDFFEMNDLFFDTLEEFTNWLKTDDYKDWKNSQKLFIKIEKTDDHPSGSLYEAYCDTVRDEFMKEIKHTKHVYTAKVIDKNKGGFLVNVKGISAFLPGGLAAPNKIVDFDLYIGKEIPVMIEDFLKEGNTFIVSNKKYITLMIPEKIRNLNFDKEYSGIITGITKFGIFIEFEDILTGLLHTAEMSDDLKYRFENEREYFSPGTVIKFKIREIQENNRLILTNRSQSDKRNEQQYTIKNFKIDYEQKMLDGEIININEKLGAFIKFRVNNTDFIGLLHNKSFTKEFTPELYTKVNVLINLVDDVFNKIYLRL